MPLNAQGYPATLADYRTYRTEMYAANAAANPHALASQPDTRWTPRPVPAALSIPPPTTNREHDMVDTAAEGAATAAGIAIGAAAFGPVGAIAGGAIVSLFVSWGRLQRDRQRGRV